MRVIKSLIGPSLLLVIGIVMPQDVLAETSMSPIEVYTRCYLQLSGLLPDTSSADYKAVEKGSLSADKACQNVFERARLGTNGIMKNRSDVVGRHVLERLNGLHRDWMSQKYFNGLSTYSAMVIDEEEPALYFTRAALTEGQNYSSVFTYNSELKGYRVPLNGTALPNMERKRLFGRASYFNADVPDNVFRLGFYQWDPVKNSFITTPATVDLGDSQQIPFGVLEGVVAAPQIVLPNYYLARQVASLPDLRPQLRTIASSGIAINKHFGGGILGSQGFILTNTNLVVRQLPQDESVIHRRLTSRVYQDLLCHTLPTLTVEDVKKDVQPSSPMPFRQSASCMQCHTSLDPMAYGYRHLSIERTFSAGLTDRMYGHHVDHIVESPLVNNPKYFTTQTPIGHYAYRSLVDGKLMSGQFNTLTQLGSVLAQSDDFYRCSAKKYYKYFTGVDVQMVSREPAGSAEAVHQNMVLTLASKLKSTGSLSEMLKALFGSSIYQSRNFKSIEVQK
jgi:hypothetical protein